MESSPAVKPVVFSRAEDRTTGSERSIGEQTFRFGGRAINCAVGPQNGPPLLLLHGVTRCWRDFEALLPRLGSSFQIFAPDLRGHGGSAWDGTDYRVADYAADVADLLDSEIRAPAVLFGHSLGAMVAAVAAASRPGLVRGLILEDPPGTTLAQGIHRSRFHLQFTNTQRVLAGARDVETLTRDLADMEVQRPSDGAIVRFGDLRDLATLRFGAECLVRMDPAVLRTLGDGRWLEGLDWFGMLSRITCPTLVVRADPACGGMLDDIEAAKIRSLIPQCAFVDMPGANHSIHSSQPERMLALINEFLDTNNLLSMGTKL